MEDTLKSVIELCSTWGLSIGFMVMLLGYALGALLALFDNF